VATIVTGEGESFAVLCVCIDGDWQVDLLPARITEGLDTLIAATRGQPAGVQAILLANISDDFFVAARRQGNDDLLLLSDITAAAVDDLAQEVCERLGVEVPADEEADDDVEPVGDLDIFEDLGLAASDLSAILADIDAYADEQLLSIARHLGFDESFGRVVDVLLR
jgi:putative tRNA adenosine deaminase-associated protein